MIHTFIGIIRERNRKGGGEIKKWTERGRET